MMFTLVFVVCRVCPVRKESLTVDMDKIPLLGCIHKSMHRNNLVRIHKYELDYSKVTIYINETKIY